MKNFKIKPVKNGIILTDNEGEEVVFQNTEDSEHEQFADFLRYLSNEYGPSDGRYSDARIYISVAPGDKHKDYKCPFCGRKDDE